jgi:hypothetical protein
VKAEFHEDGRTDSHDEANCRFSPFCQRAQNCDEVDIDVGGATVLLVILNCCFDRSFIFIGCVGVLNVQEKYDKSHHLRDNC